MQRFSDDPQSVLFPGGRVIAKGVIKTYTAATHKADVQLVGSHPTVLTALRVATNIPAADVVVGRQCTVLFVDPANQDDAVVLTIQGAVPSTPGGGGGAPSPHGEANHSGDVIPAADQDFGGFKARSVGAPLVATDAIRRQELDDHLAAADPHTMALFDAIVDGVGAKPNHYTEITSAITAAKVNIAVLPKPSAGRYAAYTIASGDAARSVQGVGPGVLIGAPTVTKGGVLLKLLDSNGRVTLGTTLGVHRNITCERVYCDAAADTGFTIHPSADAAVLLSCRVVNTTGIALDLVSASRTFVFDFAVQECTGVNVIRAVNPNQVVLVNLNLSNTAVAPTQHGILIQANGAAAALKLINASLAFTVPSTYRCIRVEDLVGDAISDIRLQNLDAVTDDGLTPAVYIDNPAGLVILDGLAFQGTHTAVIELPATSVSPTIIANASSYSPALAGYAALVTGSGKWQGKDNNLGAAPTLKDRYQFTGLEPSSDNLSGIQVGAAALAWAQAWAYIHGIKNYAEFWTVAAPANPATSRSRLYQKTIDANNEGLFIKIKQAGVITEVQIA